MRNVATILLLLVTGTSAQTIEYINNALVPTLPCDDFYDYACSGIQDAQLPKLLDVRFIRNDYDIDQYQDYVYPNEVKNRSLWEVVDKKVISEYCVQLDTLIDGINWADYKERHDNFWNKTEEEQLEEVAVLLNNTDFVIASRFYQSLKVSVKTLRDLKLPVTMKNPYYHGLFQQIRELHIGMIQKHSVFDQSEKDVLIKNLMDTKVIFGYFDYNNVKYWEEAKREYEKEYYRLKAVISLSELEDRDTEKAIRIFAMKPAMKVFEKYIQGYSERFIFQHIIAVPTRDCFNYQNEIHISVLTRIDPFTEPDAVISNILFALTHETLHVHYNLDPPPFRNETFERERQCVVDEMKRMGENDEQLVKDKWNPEKYIYEDISTLEGLRIMMLYAAQNSYNDDQMRRTLERSILPFCVPRVKKNLYHNPQRVSHNTAVAQLPIFKHLYNCTSTDRMFVSLEKTCETLGIVNTLDDYEVQKVDEKEFPALSAALLVLEDVADDFNSTEIFEVDVLEKTSDESSSEEDSSESDENEDMVHLPMIEEDDDLIIALNDTVPDNSAVYNKHCIAYLMMVVVIFI